MQKPRRSSWWLASSLILGTALVVALGVELREARAAYTDLARRSHVLQPGMYAPLLDLHTLDGTQTTIGSDNAGRCQVLLIFNTSCEFCRASVPDWNELARRAVAEASVVVFGVSLDPPAATRRYLDTHRALYPGVVLPDQRSRSLLRAGTVPQMLLVSSAGRVLFSRPGVPTAGAMDSLWTIAGGAAGEERIACDDRSEGNVGIE